MRLCLRRREFIAALGGAAAWPLAARAQKAAIPVIGYLNFGSPESDAPRLTGLRRGLNQAGYVEGRNFVIEYRWAENRADRLPALAADLVQLQVAVIVAAGWPPALAAKAATTSIPIVFSVAANPVQLGLVASLNRPGGNLTGFNALAGELGAKQLGLLHGIGAQRFDDRLSRESRQSDIRAIDERRAGGGDYRRAKGSNIESKRRPRTRRRLREPGAGPNRGAARR